MQEIQIIFNLRICLDWDFVIQISKFRYNRIGFMDIVTDPIIQLLNATHQMLDGFVQIIDTLQFSLQRWHNHFEYIQ